MSHRVNHALEPELPEVAGKDRHGQGHQHWSGNAGDATDHPVTAAVGHVADTADHDGGSHQLRQGTGIVRVSDMSLHCLFLSIAPKMA